MPPLSKTPTSSRKLRPTTPQPYAKWDRTRFWDNQNGAANRNYDLNTGSFLAPNRFTTVTYRQAGSVFVHASPGVNATANILGTGADTWTSVSDAAKFVIGTPVGGSRGLIGGRLNDTSASNLNSIRDLWTNPDLTYESRVSILRDNLLTDDKITGIGSLDSLTGGHDALDLFFGGPDMTDLQEGETVVSLFQDSSVSSKHPV